MFSATLFDGLTTTKSTKTTDVALVDVPDPGKSTMYKIDNKVAQAGVIDDSYWRTLHINSENGTVCSYRLLNQNQNANNNIFEVKLGDMKNVQIGLYYGQYSIEGRSELEEDIREEEIGDFTRLIDMKIFDP